MGITLNIWQLADETIADIVADPTIIAEVIEELKEYNDELPEEQKILLNIDKSWAGLSYLLKKNVKSPVVEFLEHGGMQVKKEVGSGPARIFSVELTRDIAKITSLPFKELTKNISASNLTAEAVYPFSRTESESAVYKYLLPYWQALGQFTKDSVGLQRGLMLYLV